MTGTRRLIYVHGVRPKPAPAVHRAVLRECLLEGVRRADPEVAASMAADPDWLDLVSWGHLLYDEYRDLDLDRPGIVRLLANPTPRPADIADVFTWRYRLRYLGYQIGDRFPPLITLLARPDTRRNLADTARYFADVEGVGTRARALVTAALDRARAAHATVLLMAHSFGSVIAWDALWQRGQQRPVADGVELLLTMGSPLGNRLIRPQLLGANAPPGKRYPPGIRRWVNLAAIGGLTALGRRFADDFREMQQLGVVEEIRDRTDLINPFVGDAGLNVHKCFGYFVNRATGEAIAGWWRSGR